MDFRSFWKENVAICLAICLISTTGIFFSPILIADFLLWDDNINVYQNPHLNPVTWNSWRSIWSEGYYQLFTPLTYSLWALTASFSTLSQPVTTISGSYSLSPVTFHSLNWLLHIVNTLLVFALLRTVKQRNGPSFAGALFFALHPLQVEPVAWVTGMNTLLATFFSFLALWLYLVARQKQTEKILPKNSRHFFTGAFVCFVLALLSKPTAVVVPLLAAILDRWMWETSWRQLAGRLGLWGLAALVCITITQSIQGSSSEPLPDFPLWQRFFVAGDALNFYGRKLLWPAQLSADYGRTLAWLSQQSWFYFSWLAPALLTSFLWKKHRHTPLWMAWCFFVAGLLPMLGLVPYYFHIYSTVADRYVYVAMLGPALALAWGFSQLHSSKVRALCLAAIMGLGLKSHLQTWNWNNSAIFFEHTRQVNPRSWMALYNLGSIYERQGHWEQAAEFFQAAIAVRPDYAQAVNNLGNVRLQQGRMAEAEGLFRQAVILAPNSAAAHSNLGVFYLNQGKLQNATLHLRRAVASDPQFIGARYNLALVLIKQGEKEAARTQLRDILKRQPNFRPAQQMQEALGASTPQR